VIKISGLTDIDTVAYTQALFENPVFNTVFMEFRAVAIESWSNSLPDQVDEREKAWALYKAADTLLEEFKSILEEARLRTVMEQQDKEADERGE